MRALRVVLVVVLANLTNAKSMCIIRVVAKYQVV